MDINLNNLEHLSNDKIFQKLIDIIDFNYIFFESIGITKNYYYDFVMNEISKSKNEYIGDIPYDRYLLKKIVLFMKKTIGSKIKEPEKQLRILDAYINKNFVMPGSYDDSIKNLDKFSLFFSIYQLDIKHNVLFEIIKGNELLSSTIGIIVKEHYDEILSGKLFYLFDSRVEFLIDTYCMLNGINEEDTSMDDEYLMDEGFSSSESLKLYIDELWRIPVLSIPEEIDLAKKVSSGDKDARDKFITSNLRLVVNIAKKYVGRGLDISDLIQEGNIALALAVDKYDVSLGYKFSTFATAVIKHYIVRSIEEKGRVIRLSSNMYDKIIQYKNVVRRLEINLNRLPTLNEIADEMNLPLSEVSKIYYLVDDTISINTVINNTDDKKLSDILSSSLDNPEEDTITNIMIDDFHKFLRRSNLTFREKKILMGRYGFNNEKPKKLHQLAKEFGITVERVRQLEDIAIKKLKSETGIKDFAVYMDNPDEALRMLEGYRPKHNSRVSFVKEKKTIYDYFDKYAMADVDYVLTKLNYEELELLGKKISNGCLDEEEYRNENTKLNEVIFPKIEKMLSEIVEYRKSAKLKTIYEYFLEYPKNIIDMVIKKLSLGDKRLLKAKYGNDLDNPTFRILDAHDLNEFHNVLIPKIRKLLEEEKTMSNVLNKEYLAINDRLFNMGFVDTVSKEDYEKALELINSQEFSHIMNSLNVKEIIVVFFKFGYIDGKFFSVQAISEFLDMDVSEINYIAKKALVLYKNNIIYFMDTVNKLKNEENKRLIK